MKEITRREGEMGKNMSRGHKVGLWDDLCRGVLRYARSVGAGPCVCRAADTGIDVPVCAPTLSSTPELRPSPLVKGDRGGCLSAAAPSFPKSVDRESSSLLKFLFSSLTPAFRLTVGEAGKDKAVAVIAGKGKQIKEGDKVRGKL